MSKVRTFAAGIAVGAIIAAGAATAQNQLRIFVNGSELADSGAYIDDGKTYIPLRAVSEALGADVEWNGEEYSVSVTSKSISKLKLESNEILADPAGNGQEFELVLEAVANSWNDSIVSDSIYDKLSGQTKTTVEQILAYKFEFGAVPEVLNKAFSEYWTEEMNSSILYKNLTDVFDVENSGSGFALKEKSSN
ncbi:MAG: copper amine oxidase N-terminal domain-containing protein [Clostridia bacterium]|nr:copper amine oxidase N-terminal domain-containing protein [Clostridia bacterium]